MQEFLQDLTRQLEELNSKQPSIVITKSNFQSQAARILKELIVEFPNISIRKMTRIVAKTEKKVVQKLFHDAGVFYMEGFPDMRRDLEATEYIHLLGDVLVKEVKKKILFKKIYFTKNFKIQYQYVSKIRDAFYFETEDVRKEKARLKEQLMEYMRNH